MLQRQASLQSRSLGDSHAAADRRHTHSDTLHANSHTVREHLSEAHRLRDDHDATSHRQTDLEVPESVGGLCEMLPAHQTRFSPGFAATATRSAKRGFYDCARSKRSHLQACTNNQYSAGKLNKSCILHSI